MKAIYFSAVIKKLYKNFLTPLVLCVFPFFSVFAEDEKIVTEVAVHVGKITRATIHAYVTAYGIVEPEPATRGKPAASARLASPFSGIIAEANCYEGQQVKKGDLLFRLDSRATEVALKKAQQAAEFAEQNLERQKKLLKIEGTSQKALQESEQQVNAAQSELATAETQTKLLRVESPLDGTIVQVHARPGEAVDANSFLAEVIDLERLVVTANVPSGEVAPLKTGTEVKFSIDGESPAAGKLIFISPRVDIKTGTVLIRASIPPDSFRSGQVLSLRIVSNTHKNVLAVPLESLVKGEGGKNFIAIVDGNKATNKEVKAGLRENKLVEVEGEGLKEGMEVVTTGAYGLPKETKIHVLVK